MTVLLTDKGDGVSFVALQQWLETGITIEIAGEMKDLGVIFFS